MPKLEITVEMFLNACSYQELQELSLMLDSAIRRKQRDEAVKKQRNDRGEGGWIQTLPHHD